MLEERSDHAADVLMVDIDRFVECPHVPIGDPALEACERAADGGLAQQGRCPNHGHGIVGWKVVGGCR